MKTIEIEQLGVAELSVQEKTEFIGGVFPWAAFWLGVGIGVGAMAVYDFANGVYAGIKQEIAAAK